LRDSLKGLRSRYLSLLLSFVFLALFGLVIYVGVFLFLAVAVYLLIAGIKDEFLRHRRKHPPKLLTHKHKCNNENKTQPLLRLRTYRLAPFHLNDSEHHVPFFHKCL